MDTITREKLEDKLVDYWRLRANTTTTLQLLDEKHDNIISDNIKLKILDETIETNQKELALLTEIKKILAKE